MASYEPTNFGNLIFSWSVYAQLQVWPYIYALLFHTCLRLSYCCATKLEKSQLIWLSENKWSDSFFKQKMKSYGFSYFPKSKLVRQKLYLYFKNHSINSTCPGYIKRCSFSFLVVVLSFGRIFATLEILNQKEVWLLLVAEISFNVSWTWQVRF